MNEWSDRARKCATMLSSVGRKSIPAAAVVLLLFAILSSSGCIGLTGAHKPASNQQNTSGAATISVAPSSIKFGSVGIGGTASQSVTISNGGGSNLTVTQANTTAAGVTITGISLPLTIGAGKQSTFNVVFSPQAAGALSGNVSIMSDISSSPSTVSLSGIGMAATALLTTSTSNLSFGNVALGKSSVLSVTLTNAGNSNVTVSQVKISGGNYSVSGVSAGLILAPGQSAALDAAFSPVAAGNSAGSVTVVSNATNSPETISLSGNGTQTVSHSVELSWTFEHVGRGGLQCIQLRSFRWTVLQIELQHCVRGDLHRLQRSRRTDILLCRNSRNIRRRGECEFSADLSLHPNPLTSLCARHGRAGPWLAPRALILSPGGTGSALTVWSVIRNRATPPAGLRGPVPKFQNCIQGPQIRCKAVDCQQVMRKLPPMGRPSFDGTESWGPWNPLGTLWKDFSSISPYPGVRPRGKWRNTDLTDVRSLFAVG